MTEQEKKAVKKRLIIFITISAIIAWILFLLVPVLGMTYGQGSSIILVAAAMFAPAISSILTRLITKEGFHNMYLRPHFKGHIKHYILIFFGPAILLFLGGAIYFLIFPQYFDPGLSVIKGMAAAGGAGFIPAPTLLLISILQVVILGPVINIIPTMGEELGWRGYMLPKFRMLLSDRAALIVTGVIWGLWHAPIIVLGHNYGTNYFGYPILGILAMVVFCVSLGIIEGYVSIKLQSAIPAAMIHSAVNAGAGGPILLATGSYNALLGPTATGIIGGLPLIILAVILFVKTGSQRAELKMDAKKQIEPARQV